MLPYEDVGARWSEFDLEARLWTLQAERYKNGYVHTVYLTNVMLAALNAMPQFNDVDCLFSLQGIPVG